MNAKPLQSGWSTTMPRSRGVLEKALKGSGMTAKSFDQADNVLLALRSEAPDVLDDRNSACPEAAPRSAQGNSRVAGPACRSSS